MVAYSFATRNLYTDWANPVSIRDSGTYSTLRPTRRMAVTGLLGSCSRQKSMASRFCDVNHVSLLDMQAKTSSEVCGRQREAAKLRGGFWDHLTRGLVPTRSILATSGDGRLVMVYDSSRAFETVPGGQLVLCKPTGEQLARLWSPFEGGFGDFRLAGEDSVIAVGELIGKGESSFGVHRGSWSGGAWTMLGPLVKPSGFEETFTTDGVTVLISERKRLVDVTKGLVVGRGDCPRLSPDRKFLYLRTERSLPSLVTWPGMRPVSLKYNHSVGTCAEWSPAGDMILLERMDLGVNRLKMVDLLRGDDQDVGSARMYGRSGHTMRWIEWGDLGPQTINTFGESYLASGERVPVRGAGPP